MFKHLMVLSQTFGTAAAASPALAQSHCAQRDAVIERLEVKYEEQLTAGGLAHNNRSQTFVEIWASNESGTFTVLVTSPGGISCVVATGTDFFTATAKPGLSGTPS